MRTTRSIVVLGALLWASAFSPRALAEKSVCDEKVKSLANPYKHALVLLEQERSQLAAQHLRYFEPMRVIYKSLQMWDPVLEDEQLSEILTNIRKDDMRIRAFRLDAGFRATNEAFAGKPFGKVLDQALDASSKLRFETGVYTDTQDIAADLEKIREAAKAKGKKS